MITQGNIEVTWSKADVENIPYVTRYYTDALAMPASTALDQYKEMTIVDHYSSDQLYSKFIKPEYFTWLTNKVGAIHRMQPGYVLPWHEDNYVRYRQSHGIQDVNQIIRVIVFLEDWKIGHIFQLTDRLLSGWKAGDWICWAGNNLHLAANLGIENRYTFQITGFLAAQ
jgi:hypothetical protein